MSGPGVLVGLSEILNYDFIDDQYTEDDIEDEILSLVRGCDFDEDGNPIYGTIGGASARAEREEEDDIDELINNTDKNMGYENEEDDEDDNEEGDDEGGGESGGFFGGSRRSNLSNKLGNAGRSFVKAKVSDVIGLTDEIDTEALLDGADDYLARASIANDRRNALGRISGTTGSTFSYVEERKDDQKSAMLNEIAHRLEYLKFEEVDVSRIPEVDEKSKFGAVKNVLASLRDKCSMHQYSNTTDQIVEVGAIIMGDFFDGEKSYWGYKPNLEGWHRTVVQKSSFNRFNTARYISNFVQEGGIVGAIVGVLIDYIPGMFLYSKRKNEEKDHKSKLRKN